MADIFCSVNQWYNVNQNVYVIVDLHEMNESAEMENILIKICSCRLKLTRKQGT